MVVCIQHRLYFSYKTTSSDDFFEGIAFWTQRENRLVVNYPQLHYDFGVQKNRDKTQGHYKPLVRIFKNAKSRLVSSGILTPNIAPSYFVECLMFNVSDELFKKPYSNAYLEILGWLAESDISTFRSQNRIIPLYGSSNEQWNESYAWKYLAALLKLWKEY